MLHLHVTDISGPPLPGASSSPSSIQSTSSSQVQNIHHHPPHLTHPTHSQPRTRHHPICAPNTLQAFNLDSRETPPPLHFSPAISSDRASIETTPLGTPRGYSATLPKRGEKEKENQWSRGFGESYVDSALLEADLEDSTFPLFHDTNMSTMGSHATPMSFGKQSSMATALQNASGNDRPSTSGSRFGHRDSVNAAAQPISMSSRSNQNKPRRESLASSMVTGMSWGGASVGSWIRDE